MEGHRCFGHVPEEASVAGEGSKPMRFSKFPSALVPENWTGDFRPVSLGDSPGVNEGRRALLRHRTYQISLCQISPQHAGPPFEK